jgi:Zn-finger nucleic acid-binding protein
MECPSCGVDAGFQEHADFSVCSQTGYVQGVWLTCNACSKETDYDELDRIFAVYPEGAVLDRGEEESEMERARR